MSASLEAIIGQLAPSAISFVSNALNIIPQGNIGGIPIDVTVEEHYTDNLAVTQHPVEGGAAITDHSYMQPPEITLTCGWSNSSSQALSGAVNSLFAGDVSAASDYVSSIYSSLRSVQQSGQLLTVVSSIRQYTNMLITSLSLTRDRNTSQALMITATCKNVIIVSTQSATIPPTSSQADAANTAEKTTIGPQTLQAAPQSTFVPYLGELAP